MKRKHTLPLLFGLLAGSLLAPILIAVLVELFDRLPIGPHYVRCDAGRITP